MRVEANSIPTNQHTNKKQQHQHETQFVWK